MLSARANCRLDHMEMVECSALEPWTVASYAIFDCVVLCCSCGNLFFCLFFFVFFFSLSLSHGDTIRRTRARRAYFFRGKVGYLNFRQGNGMNRLIGQPFFLLVMHVAHESWWVV